MVEGGGTWCQNRVPPFLFLPKGTKMKPFNWSVTAFDFSPSRRSTHKLQVEEAEDKVSEAIMLIKQARSQEMADATSDLCDDILIDLSTVVDKLRKLRTDLKFL